MYYSEEGIASYKGEQEAYGSALGNGTTEYRGSYDQFKNPYEGSKCLKACYIGDCYRGYQG